MGQSRHTLGVGSIIQTLPQSCHCKHSNTRTWINTRTLNTKISEPCRVNFVIERRISNKSTGLCLRMKYFHVYPWSILAEQSTSSIKTIEWSCQSYFSQVRSLRGSFSPPPPLKMSKLVHTPSSLFSFNIKFLPFNFQCCIH